MLTMGFAQWEREVKECCPGVPIFLVGTKTDLRARSTFQKRSPTDMVQTQRVSAALRDQGGWTDSRIVVEHG